MRFAKLGLTERLLHLTADPSVAYLLLMVGLLLIVFEFFTAGVGRGRRDAARSALVLAAYGLAVLPTSPLGLALIALGVFGSRVDVQAGAPRAWTGIGAVSLLIGSLAPVPGRPRRAVAGHPSLMSAGVALFMLSGMPAMVRARFSTPTIGRESMIGEMGEATTGDRPRGHGRPAGRQVAGPHQPGHAHRRRRAGAGGRHRRPAAGGRARGRAAPRTPDH